MSLAIGITGLAQAGKSTFFSALTAVGDDPGGRKATNRARAPVPDERLSTLSEHFRPKKHTPAIIDFVDMPGGGSGGLGAQALGEIRTATALVEVVRCFEHSYLGAARPQSDMEDFDTEIMLADLKIIEGRLERQKKLGAEEAEVLRRLQKPLSEGHSQGLPGLTQEERKLISGLGLLSVKPRIYAANLAEGSDPALVKIVASFAASRSAQHLAACALLEAEIAQLAEEDRRAFLEELGIVEPGLDALVRASFAQMDLMTFFTVGEDECRAWTVEVGARAPKAAGVIHSDLERGFIRAEVINYAEFVACGGMNEAKQQGKLRIEGRDYVVQEGDILNIRFNV